MLLLSNYITQVQRILNDTSQSVWSQAEVTDRINDARLDASRDFHSVRRNVVGVQLLPGVEIYNLDGAVAGANVTAGGSNYGTGATVPVTFSAPPAGGIQALGTGNLLNGSLSSISMTQWGQGYQAVPTIAVGGTGSGAAATAVTLFQSNPLSSTIGNPLAIVGIANQWNNQRYTLGYQPFIFFNAYARNWVNLSNQGPPGLFTHVNQDRKVYIRNAPDQIYNSEWDTVFMTAPLVATTDSDAQMIEPWNSAVQFKACAYLLYKMRNFQEINAMESKYKELVPHIITTSGGIRIPNPYHKTIQRRVIGMGG